MTEKRAVPGWLLNELLLTSGFFESKTTVRGQRNNHSYAVATVGSDLPSWETTIDLTTRQNWEWIREKLANEGF